MLKPINYSGFMFATVVNNVDPKNEYRVQVLIKRLLIDSDIGDSIYYNEVNVNDNMLINDKNYNNTVYTSNFIWVRPLFFMENANKKNIGGSFRIPQIYQHVLVYFIDDDPQKGYYFPFTPSIKGDTFSKINSSCDLSKPEEVANNHTLSLNDSGTRIEVDNNEETNSVNIVVDNFTYGAEAFKINIANNKNQKKLTIEGTEKTKIEIENTNGEEIIRLKLTDGTIIEENKNANEKIKIKDSEGNSIILKKDGINITSAKDINMTAGGNVNIKGSNIYLN